MKAPKLRLSHDSTPDLPHIPNTFRLRPAALALAAFLLPAFGHTSDSVFDMGTLGGLSEALAISADGDRPECSFRRMPQ